MELRQMKSINCSYFCYQNFKVYEVDSSILAEIDFLD